MQLDLEITSMTERRLPTVGDYVGRIIGMPGEDITVAKVIAETPEGLLCYEPFFDLEFTAKPISKFGHGGVWLFEKPEEFRVNVGGLTSNTIEMMQRRGKVA